MRGRGHGVHADVELPTLVEQGLLEVLLNNVGALTAVDGCAINDLLDLIQIAAHCNPAATVCIFAWLHNPEAVAEVRVLGKNWVLIWVVENVHETLKLLVRVTFFDVKRQRQIIKRVLTKRFVVALHIVVDGLLVAQVEVVFLMVVRDKTVRSVVFGLGLLFILLAAVCTIFPEHICRAADCACFACTRSDTEFLALQRR
jgi:hypothetical protein